MSLKRQCIIFILLFYFLTPLWAADIHELLQTKINTNFAGTSLDNVLRMLSKQYNVNIVVGGEAKGPVTARLYDVSLAEALSTILKTHGYHYVVGDNVIMIKPLALESNRDLQTEVFDLKYVDAYRLKATLETLLSERGKMEPLLSEMGKEKKDYRAHLLLVSDLRENLEAIRQSILFMDKPEKQIQIEVRLVERTLGDEQNVGLNLPKSFTVKTTGAEISAPITQTGTGQSGQPTLLSAWYQLPNAAKDLTLGVLTFDELKAALDLLAKDQSAKLISNPKVTTLNNKKASVRIGRTVPIPQISRSVAGDLFSYQDKRVNIQLDVLPQIGNDSMITLDVHPLLEEIVGYTGPADAPYPITAVREVNSTVRIKDGETLVIGGLVKETETEREEKVWLLGDIPILGYLFTHVSKNKQKTDLLIFITTKIME
ncbi:MAG TPA: DUF4974 domain-containing protein [Caldithrix abyssi]|uniref:DUF4974 domain-containing protein n=1 Tax=Caldithrix abyssi TaxID=187145 RepID=A0A7V4WVW5_CALAY|nr:DUF4974 domain-containing protein [Caldithrix abyssi]